LDVGFGKGTHSQLIRNQFKRDNILLVGIEGFPQYIRPEFHQADNFDVMFIGNVIEVVPSLPSEWSFDLVICADVIEHLDREEGIAVLEQLKHIASNIIVTLPVCDYPQGPSEGNNLEIHKTQWKEHEMNELGFKTIKIFTFGEIGHSDQSVHNLPFQGVFKWME
jgi:hypothetical protein